MCLKAHFFNELKHSTFTTASQLQVVYGYLLMKMRQRIEGKENMIPTEVFNLKREN